MSGRRLMIAPRTGPLAGASFNTGRHQLQVSASR